MESVDGKCWDAKARLRHLRGLARPDDFYELPEEVGELLNRAIDASRQCNAIRVISAGDDQKFAVIKSLVGSAIYCCGEDIMPQGD
jgi:hypothetical protein